MRLLDSIKAAKARAEHEAKEKRMSVSKRVVTMHFSDACRLIVEELKQSRSITMSNSLLKVFNDTLEKTDSQAELYDAFVFLYRLSNEKNSGWFVPNLSQRVGKKLYQTGDDRVETDSDESYFRPKYY